MPNWHIDAVCEHLEAVSAGEIRNLILNVPPRHMKSLGVAVFWPTWDWLTHPERQWLFGSYAEKLSKRDSLKSRRIVEAAGGRKEDGTLFERIGYRSVVNLLGKDWELTGDQNEKLRFENTESGYRIATSVGGTATGEGGDILVLDDPHKADDAESSEIKRENVNDWIDGTLSTRLNNPKTGATVVVMQRLHEDDATGHLLEQGDWEHLCLPAEYEPNHPFIWPEDPRTEEGELLWKGRFDEEELEKLKKRLGPNRRPGQLQQLPYPAEGGMYKDFWWRFYEPLGWPKVFSESLQSWDMTFKKTTDGSYVVGQVWIRHKANRYLACQIRARMSFPETKKAVRALAHWCKEHGLDPDCVKLVEEKANGAAVIDELRDEVAGLVPVTVEGSKIARANATSGQVESGNVYLPGSVEHVGGKVVISGEIPAPTGYERTATADFVAEHRAFPNAVHDDQVDATTQALRRFSGASGFEAFTDGNSAPKAKSITADLLDLPY